MSSSLLPSRAHSPRARSRWRLAASALAGVAAFAVASCTGADLAQVRDFTYPPDFDYLTREELTTTMGALAREVDSLDRVMWAQTASPAEARDDVVAILERMHELASRLGEGGESNRPRVHHEAPRLIGDIERALAAVQKEPPDYFWAGRVSGSCTYCHEPRHHGASEMPLRRE
ncbi:MAG: hypothetical protein R3E88_14965 [Myxococcota bacterium]|nr:hypothetical protein [Myxococcales bacterium]